MTTIERVFSYTIPSYEIISYSHECEFSRLSRCCTLFHKKIDNAIFWKNLCLNKYNPFAVLKEKSWKAQCRVYRNFSKGRYKDTSTEVVSCTLDKIKSRIWVEEGSLFQITFDSKTTKITNLSKQLNVNFAIQKNLYAYCQNYLAVIDFSIIRIFNRTSSLEVTQFGLSFPCRVLVCNEKYVVASNGLQKENNIVVWNLKENRFDYMYTLEHGINPNSLYLYSHYLVVHTSCESNKLQSELLPKVYVINLKTNLIKPLDGSCSSMKIDFYKYFYAQMQLTINHSNVQFIVWDIRNPRSPKYALFSKVSNDIQSSISSIQFRIIGNILIQYFSTSPLKTIIKAINCKTSKFLYSKVYPYPIHVLLCDINKLWKICQNGTVFIEKFNENESNTISEKQF